MNRIELLDFIANRAKEFRTDAIAHVNRNPHMNKLGGKCELSQDEVDAVLVGFVNHCGIHQGIDYAMYTVDLEQPTKGAERDAG